MDEDVRIEDIDHKLNWLDFGPALNHVPRGSKLLDVGCGKGTFLAFLKKHRPDIEAEGVDRNPDYVDICIKKGLKVRVGDAEYLDYPPKSFDIVTSFHLLEHLKNERKALFDMIKIARKRVILILPKTIISLKQLYGIDLYHYTPFYTPLGLYRLLEGIKAVVLLHYKPTGIYESWLVIIEVEDSNTSQI